MISDEERREVAQSLRHCSAYGDGANLSEWWARLQEVATGEVDFPSPRELFERLADLIDPTCEVVGTTSEDGLYGPTIFHHELSCGHTCDTGWSEPSKYCDECGARIMEVDDGE